MSAAVRHLTMNELEAGLAEIRQAPKDDGVLQLIVRRPNVDEREILQEAKLETQPKGWSETVGSGAAVLEHPIDLRIRRCSSTS